MNPKIKSFYHYPTFTWSHIVYCEEKKLAAIIDPVLDYQMASGIVTNEFVNSQIDYLKSHKLSLIYVLETHAHADHLTAANLLKQKFPNSKIGIGEGIKKVQKVFKNIFNLGDNFSTNGSQFDMLLSDSNELSLGNHVIKVCHVPGHTEDSVCYLVGENVFIGDTMFAPEYGTARCDFPGGDSSKLYDSIQKIFSFGENKRLYLCHDYPKDQREPQAFFTSIEQQSNNVHINNTISKQQFTHMRAQKDKSLGSPSLLLPSVQVNIVAGQLPAKELNGVSYLKIPISLKLS
jgi:glyoxylase-like metal-dependent hydrolase (beta-lactamase superfamily II)